MAFENHNCGNSVGAGIPRPYAAEAFGRGIPAPTKSNRARSVQYRAHQQAADSSTRRLLTRAVLYRCPNVAWPDLDYVTSPARFNPTVWEATRTNHD
jgi:hypothetical protein